MKNLYLPLILLFIFKSHAQDLELPFKFGDVPANEFSLKYYKKDSTANAVVLYEKAQNDIIVLKKKL